MLKQMYLSCQVETILTTRYGDRLPCQQMFVVAGSSLIPVMFFIGFQCLCCCGLFLIRARVWEESFMITNYAGNMWSVCVFVESTCSFMYSCVYAGLSAVWVAAVTLVILMWFLRNRIQRKTRFHGCIHTAGRLNRHSYQTFPCVRMEAQPIIEWADSDVQTDNKEISLLFSFL